MRKAVLFALAMMVALPTAAAADCRKKDKNAQLAACTAEIRASGATKAQKRTGYLYRCQANDILGKFNEARIDCLESLRLGDDASTWNSLSIVYQNLGRYSDALDASNKAVAKTKKNKGSFTNTRANAHCKAGNVNASVNDRLAAINLGHFSAKRVQQFLKGKGVYNGLVDGKFGSGSKAALRKWTAGGCR